MNKQEILDKLNETVYGHLKTKKILINLFNRSELRYLQKFRDLKPDNECIPSLNCLLIGNTGTGKEQPLSALVSTPKGFKTMGDMEIGDIVHSFKGTAKVVGIYPQGIKPVYKVTFSDGRTCEAGLEHLWAVATTKLKFNNKYKIVTTKYLLDNRDINLYVPLSEAVEYGEKDYIIPPYSLGVLIGDGCLTCPGIKVSSTESDIIEKVSKELGLSFSKNKHNHTFSYSTIKRKDRVFREYLDSVGLTTIAGDKYIPKEYLLGSINQRKQLLKGLMDTDGCVGSKNRFTFSTTSFRLKDDFIYLCRSLGLIATVSKDNRGGKYSSGECYLICIQTNEVIFSSEKHLRRYKENMEKYSTTRKENKTHIKIIKVECVREEQSQCIMLNEGSSNLYLTNDFVVTHNTHLVESLAKLLDRPFIKFDASLLNPVSNREGLNVKKVIEEIRKYTNSILEMESKKSLQDRKYRSFDGIVSQLIVYIDEFDKMCFEYNDSNWKKGTQSEFLTLFENKSEFQGISFIFSGAFSGLIKEKKQVNLGFNHYKEESKEIGADILNKELIKFGVTPELLGRIGHISVLDNLSVECYQNILNTMLLPDFYKTAESLGVKDMYLSHERQFELATRAHLSGLGARGLKTELNELLIDLEFEADNSQQLEYR